MRKLILKSRLSPGDIVMMTAAVRDLQLCYPGQFHVDVRTSCSEIWENNPHLTPLSETDPDAEIIECSYPLIDRCNWTPYHCLHGYIDFLNTSLGLSIRPTLFKGDIHLSPREKSWHSQIHELTRQDIPFWIVSAGGKYDVTVKWWPKERFQEVIDHFKGRIQFAQVGRRGHHHPRLDNVIDLRGQTTLRELIRLVYHSQGVLCPVTALMHLAAAVETRTGASRACVVVAGGREPAHWEAYPDHQFIHTNGALACSVGAGCWKDRVVPLGDGDERDGPDHLCVNPAGRVPRCMDLIASEEVVRRVALYFGRLRYLSKDEWSVAQLAVHATARNDFDDQPLNLHNARFACDEFVGTIPPYPGTFKNRGIVICGGGARYFTNAWVCINMLRQVGCRLPVELWHLGDRELDSAMESLLVPFNVRCVDASKMRKRYPVRRLGGWELKPYAILHSRFKEVLLIDADNVPVVDPEFLFESPEFRETGAIFWPDYMERSEQTKAIWHSCGVPSPDTPEVESGQIIVDKERCWEALRLAMWFNESSDFYYQYLHGDKETFLIAFARLGKSWTMVPKPIQRLNGTMCQHDFDGRRIFQHRNTDKWNLFLNNEEVADFWFEEDCRRYVRRLQNVWDGRLHRYQFPDAHPDSDPRLACCVIGNTDNRGCELSDTDWPHQPIIVTSAAAGAVDSRVKLALQEALSCDADFFLFVEEGLTLNRSIYSNLTSWKLLRKKRVTFAGLLPAQEEAYDLENDAIVAEASSVSGPVACVLSRSIVGHLLRHWDDIDGPTSSKMAVIVSAAGHPIVCHVPALAHNPVSPSRFLKNWSRE